MAKNIRVDDLTYNELVSLSGRFTTETQKPVSIGMTVTAMLKITEGVIELNPKHFWETFKNRFRGKQIFSPKEFEAFWDLIAEKIQE